MKIIDRLNEDRINISFEVFPPKTDAGFANVQRATDEIAKLDPSYISVTYGAGGGTSKNTAKIASHIKDDLHVLSLAHLTCASSTKEEVREVIRNLKELGIENILALRGDIPEGMKFPDGDRFHYAYELVEEIRKQGDFCIGAACYPEGHVENEHKEDDIRFLKQKVDCGVDFLTTQMFFDNDIHYNFLPNQTILYLLNNRIPAHPDKYMCHSFGNAHIYQVHSTFFFPVISKFVLPSFPVLKTLPLQISS